MFLTFRLSLYEYGGNRIFFLNDYLLILFLDLYP